MYTAYSVGRPLVWRHLVNPPRAGRQQGSAGSDGYTGGPFHFTVIRLRDRLAHDGLSPRGWFYAQAVIFKAVGDKRPYDEHGLGVTEWASLPPGQVRLAELITTKRTLDLDALLAEDSTFFGDLFAHVVKYNGDLYLEDGLHRAVRAALQQRPMLHARILDLDTTDPADLHKRPSED